VLRTWVVNVSVQLQTANSEQVKSGVAVATYDGHSVTVIRDKQWMDTDTVRAILRPVERTGRKMEASFDSQRGKRVLERNLRDPFNG
jgi:hypothetical protein